MLGRSTAGSWAAELPPGLPMVKEAIVPASLVALDPSAVVEHSSSGEGRVGSDAAPAKDEADEYEEEDEH